jgi:hypothetical protein
MRMDYVNSNCEGKARELLAPLTGACPDSVWENVSIALAEKRKEAENKWMNKIGNIPKVPLLAAAVISVVAISSWLYFTHKSSNLNGRVTSASIVSNTPPVKAPESKINATVIQTAEVKKDSIQTQPSIKVQGSALVQNNAPLVKNDGATKNTGLNIISNKVIQSPPVIAQKDDSKPILIQHDAGNTQIIPNDQPASKGGVAVDLGGSDNSSSHPTAEMGAVEDTTAQQ